MHDEEEEIGATSVGKGIEAKGLSIKMITDGNVYDFSATRKVAMGLRDQLIEMLVGEPVHEGEPEVGRVVDLEGAANIDNSTNV